MGGPNPAAGAPYQSDAPKAAQAVEFACNGTFAEIPDDIADERFVGQLPCAVAEPTTHGAIFICLDRDAEDFSTAERLRFKSDQFGVTTPIFPWLPEADVPGPLPRRDFLPARLPHVSIEPGVMIIEMRTYKTQPGKREEFLAVFAAKSVPAHQEIGMKILGPFRSIDDPDTFFFMRGFPDLESRDPIKARFYEGELWKNELEAIAMPMIDSYDVILCETSPGYVSDDLLEKSS